MSIKSTFVLWGKALKTHMQLAGWLNIANGAVSPLIGGLGFLGFAGFDLQAGCGLLRHKN